MTLHNKILPIALVAALLGGSVGALVMRHNNAADTQVASSSLLPNSTQANGTTDATLRDDNAANTQNAVNPSDQNAYRTGFNDGFDTAREGLSGATRERLVTRATPTRVVYRTAPARSYARRSSRTAYYDYTPQRRSFWQKHRDKLTLAMGTGGGALLGGLIGGRKGAAIGALAGGGGSALYTYKLRKRNRRY